MEGPFLVENSDEYNGWRKGSITLYHSDDTNYYFKFMGTNGDPARDTICFWNGDDQGKYYFY
jgi:hypothetical protein